jgi:hypothetical protein
MAEQVARRENVERVFEHIKVLTGERSQLKRVKKPLLNGNVRIFCTPIHLVHEKVIVNSLCVRS